jgi:alkanesulfonate monooxygenase SsuD/methylene tetrahydromethanopterin reductase-like flavin-dependent oxidoreductase (luciferase family)
MNQVFMDLLRGVAGADTSVLATAHQGFGKGIRRRHSATPAIGGPGRTEPALGAGSAPRAGLLRVPTLAVHLNLDGPIEDIVARAVRAEQYGADAVYVIEGLRDPFVALAAIAAATSRVTIGTYVANAYARTPQAAATAALAIDELSGGRSMFGIGAGNRHINEWLFGLDMDHPLGKMREYLAVLRAFLQGDTGEGREVGGPIHHTETRFVRPPARRVPIIVAAAGPKMTELAATASDGVGLGILIGVEHLAGVVRPRAVAACAAAGRDPARLRFPMAALTSIDDDEHAPAERSSGCSTRSPTRTTTTCCASRDTRTSPTRRPNWGRRSAGERRWRRSTTSSSTG